MPSQLKNALAKSNVCSIISVKIFNFVSCKGKQIIKRTISYNIVIYVI